jgi:hypothetical protein
MLITCLLLGTAFTLKDRDQLGLVGLLPPNVEGSNHLSTDYSLKKISKRNVNDAGSKYNSVPLIFKSTFIYTL